MAHSALTWLISFKNLEGQTACWILHLQEYNFTEHRQGWKQNNADALLGRLCQEECTHCHKVKAWGDISTSYCSCSRSRMGSSSSECRIAKQPGQRTHSTRSRNQATRVERYRQPQPHVHMLLGSAEITPWETAFKSATGILQDDLK
jgi:hypothetical protein